MIYEKGIKLYVNLDEAQVHAVIDHIVINNLLSVLLALKGLFALRASYSVGPNTVIVACEPVSWLRIVLKQYKNKYNNSI